MIIEEAEIVLNFDGSKVSKGLNDTKKGITDLNQDAGKFGKHISNTLGDIKNVAGEISKVGAALGLVVGTTDYIRQVAIATRATDNLSKSVGMGADEITANRLANEQLGISMESTNAILADRARIAQQLKAGGDASTILGADFSRWGGSPVVMRDGSNDDKTAEYRKVYQNRIKRGMEELGETREQATSFAANLDITGWQEQLILVQMTDEAYKSLLESKKGLSGLTDESTEEAIRFNKAWAELDQTITLAANQTARNFTPMASSTLEGLGAFTHELLSESTRIYQGLTHPISNWGGFVDALTPKLNSWIKIGDKQGKQEKEQKKALEANNAELVKTVGLVKDLDRSSLSGLETTFDRIKKSVLDMLPSSVLNFFGADNGGNNGSGNNGNGGTGGVGTGRSMGSEEANRINNSASKKEHEQAAMDYFTTHGRTVAQAAGMTANIATESGYADDVISGKRKGDGGAAYGIGQWHPDRQQRYKNLYGKSINGASYAEQLQFYNDEFGAYEQNAGKKLNASRTPREAGENVSRYFERPADTQGEASRRGSLAESIARDYKPSSQLAVDTKALAQPLQPQYTQPTAIDTKALANPQTNNTSTSTNTYYVTIDLPTTDPAQSGNIIESQLKNVSKNAPYRSGMTPS